MSNLRVMSNLDSAKFLPSSHSSERLSVNCVLLIGLGASWTLLRGFGLQAEVCFFRATGSVHGGLETAAKS